MEPNRRFTGKHANGVKEYHYECEPNEGMRKGMEDGSMLDYAAIFVADRYLDNCSNSILFGVFDGHGGSKVSDYLSKQFPAVRLPLAKYFMREYKNVKKNAKIAFENAYALLDQKLKGQIVESTDMGSTATVGLILLEEADRVLYISHIGDSCAYLFDDKGGQKITSEHRGSNPSEVERVKKNGGAIMMGRLGGVLAVTRAFGDFNLKKSGLTSVPDVKRIELRLHHKYLVVASDGLWDFLNSQVPLVDKQEVAAVLKEQDEVDNIAKVLIKRAIKNGSSDNISVICLKL